MSDGCIPTAALWTAYAFGVVTFPCGLGLLLLIANCLPGKNGHRP